MKENNSNIIKSIGILTVLMVISKIFSLIREVAIANFYGVSSSTDAYFLASGFVANVFFGITAALAVVFLPYYIKIKKENEKEEVSRIFSSIITSLTLFAVIIVGLLYIFAPILIQLIAPTFSGETYNETVLFTRILSVTILFSLLTSFLTSLLNAEGRYQYGALASIIYSITSIACMIALKNSMGVVALVLSVPLSFFIQLIILAVSTKKYFKFKPVFQLMNPSVKHLLLLMIPVLLSNASVGFNQLLTRSIASGLGEGSVSIISYSNTLFNFVSTIMIATFITVFFTELSDAAKEYEHDKFNSLISKAVNSLVIVLLPIASITAIYSRDVVKIVFGRGAFDENAVTATAICLSIYAFAFVFDGVRNLLIKAFYAKDNTKTPLINSIISLVITIVAAFVFSRTMGISGIVLAITLSILVSTVFLVISARKQICTFEIKKILPTVLKALVSITVSVVVLLALSNFTMSIASIYRFGFAVVVGFTVYIGALIALKCDEVETIIHMARRKKAKINRK